MSEFFLELFSEEIPAKLQSNARRELSQIFKVFFQENEIIIKGNINIYSTPNRLIVNINKLTKEIVKKTEEIRGPNTEAPKIALEGFLKSNNIQMKQIYKKKNEKGEFYYYKKPSQKIKIFDLLKKNLPNLLRKIAWKKSMKWGEHDLYWGRPLKSILAVFDGKIVEFTLDHLKSSNKTFLNKDLEENDKIFRDYKSYNKFFKKKGIIIEQEKRKELIKAEINKYLITKNIRIDLNEKLLDEITNLVEKPKVLICEFDKRFLNIPKEILIITMQSHQKYFPTFDKKEKLTNIFLVVADIKDSNGFVKLGNERVIEARLSDAEFFWNKNRSHNLVKQVTNLKNVNYFKGLGTYLDKVQRMRKLSALISDEMLISKDKIEIASSICKVDLMSDLVSEFPELQGVMGGHFANSQGFDQEISQAVAEHYLPVGMDSKTPKKPYSIALSLSDKLDSLVGFFGLGLKPSSSKDPYALRRMAIGVVRLIVENGKKFKLRDLLNYSCTFYKEQGYKFDFKKTQKELSEFFLDRLKNYLKEKKIRFDIIECSTSPFALDDLMKIYKKSFLLNKKINKDFVIDVISVYKRLSNILNNEKKNITEFEGLPDPGLFKNDYENKLFKKIRYIKKYFLNADMEDNYEEILKTLSSVKIEVNEFFDNVIVNDKDAIIKKNRLELLHMLCKSFENCYNFSKIES